MAKKQPRPSRAEKVKPTKKWNHHYFLVSVCPNCGGTGRTKSEWYTYSDTNPVTPKAGRRK